ncbi:MAG: hypothetical protein IPP94_07360 [Ignavibacteria bacterium]|nr:hypothetical protein [Ignavibacteria bacterium]
MSKVMKMKSALVTVLLCFVMTVARSQPGSPVASAAPAQPVGVAVSSDDASLLTDQERNIVLGLNRSELSIDAVCMYVVFAESGITKKICELESKNSSYSFNIPPACKLVAVHVQWLYANRHVRITGYSNSSPVWKKVTGVRVDDGVAFSDTCPIVHPVTSLR